MFTFKTHRKAHRAKRAINFCLLFLISNACSTPGAIKEQPITPSAAEIKTRLEAFMRAAAPNRSVDREGHQQAQDWIKNKFDELAKAHGGRVYVHEFLPDIDFAVKNYQHDFDSLVKPHYRPRDAEFKKWRNFTRGAINFVQKYRGVRGHNLMLEFPGTKNAAHVISIGAHFDTITHDHATLQFTPDVATPGADDNASGVMAMVTLAEALSKSKHEKTLRFIAFDFEEIFFLGSYALAKDISAGVLPGFITGEREDGLINLEMLGWSKTPIKDHPVFKLYSRQSGKPGAAEDLAMSQIIAKYNFLLESPLKAVILANGFDRSDNWSFWQWSFPAICVSQDWQKDFNETHYHTAGDTADTLNYEYLAEIIRTLGGAVTYMAHDGF